jgi:hypothetical protein
MMTEVAILNTTTSARFICNIGGQSPASVMHVKKLSIALARQYRDISILRLFFSINNARPVGNCHMPTVYIIKLQGLEKMKNLCYNISAYRAKYNKRGIATLEDSKKQAGPSPEIGKETT